jgi:hypothetical protein
MMSSWTGWQAAARNTIRKPRRARSFADSEETAFCIVGNFLSIGLAPSTDQRAATLFRNSILVNAILNPMPRCERANSFGEKADVSQDCFSFFGFNRYF